MKKIASLFSVTALLMAVVLWGCKKDSEIPTLGTFGIEDYDIIQLTNSKPNVPVVLTYGDDQEIDSIYIKIALESAPDKRIAGTTIKNFVHSSTGKTTVQVAFPVPAAGAPSGLYIISYTITDKKGKTYTKSYKVNILNNQSAADPNCTGSYPSLPLPSGKNVWLYVTAPANTDGEDLYVSGNFEGSLSCGTGDWSGGGNACLKLTKVDGSNTCYYIALNLTGSSEFKITRGSWSKVMKNPDGSEADNIKWNSSASQFVTIKNWADRIVLPPTSLPDAGIATGKLSIVSDVKSTDDGIKYYLVKKGNPVTDKSIPMIRVANTTKVVGLVPKDQTSEYNIVKEDKKGVNSWGFETLAGKWDGKTNPINVTVSYFEGDPSIIAVPPQLYIIGSATPELWSAPVTDAQKFTKIADGVFEITINLTTGGAYLLFENNIGCCWWQQKVGGNDKLGGRLIYGGGDIPAPDETGTYKITVDFTKESYKLVKQP
jgi:hypothetical protein